MGSPIPESQPVIIPDLWYKITEQVFFSTTIPRTCDVDLGPSDNCVLGQDIIDWIASDGQCKRLVGPDPSSFFSSRLLNIGESFLSEAACLLEL